MQRHYPATTLPSSMMTKQRQADTLGKQVINPQFSATRALQKALLTILTAGLSQHVIYHSSCTSAYL